MPILDVAPPLSTPDEKDYAPVWYDATWGALRLRYWTKGTGQTKVLFIMGFGMMKEAWRAQWEFFARKSTEFQICIFDNRGVGESGTWGLDFTMDDMARDAFQLTQYLGWKTFHVVGVSMGGMISQRLALRYGHRIRSLTLINTHGGTLLPPMNTIKTVVRTLVNGGTMDPYGNFVTGLQASLETLLKLLYAPQSLSDPVKYKELKRRQAYALMNLPRTPTVGRLSQVFAMVRYGMSDAELNAIGCAGFPIQVLIGNKDIMVDPAGGKRLVKQMAATEVIYPEGAHGLIAEGEDMPGCIDVNKALLLHIRNGEQQHALRNYNFYDNPEDLLDSDRDLLAELDKIRKRK
eukprot:Clim_evm27s14 gene=Clim_evmTU27s14